MIQEGPDTEQGVLYEVGNGQLLEQMLCTRVGTPIPCLGDFRSILILGWGLRA